MTGANALQFIDSHVDSSVFIITLKKSQEGNRLNPNLLRELLAAAGEARERSDVRLLLIRSNGSIFCHGMDLTALRQSGWDPRQSEEAVGLYTELLSTLYTLPKPVIAAVQGEVKAGGVGLAAACDCVLGSEEANFELAEVFFGLIPANVLPFLAGLRISPQKARYLILTAKKIDAQEAARLGLLDEVCPKEALEKRLKDLFKRLLSFSPAALAETKSLTSKFASQELPLLLELTKTTILRLLKNKEVQQGIETFLEGGMPPWAERFKPQNPLLIKE
jgi:enoyl-CoA hydratase/carnithine racemase